ncbi:hypothetical protein [uncultured Anaerococcus sp.]|uniref:hypothetical protein n=1 Tax=uncultured Anaerococcus sp. TaxID=293428 RepID=UPI00260F46FD|nr:hypothetical protein [uncultured Anaerococcus sp.]
MASESGNSNLKNYIEKLRATNEDRITLPTIVENILNTAREKECKLISFEKSYYIQKGNNPVALFHLNIDNPSDVSFYYSDSHNKESVYSETNINLVSSALIVSYLLMYSDSSFDILISYSNIQSKIEDYKEITSMLRTDNVINLNLRQADALADEFSNLLLSLTTIPVKRFKPDFAYKTYKLSLDNLMGGHAGDNINKVRKNSIKMIIGFFRKLKSKVDLEMVSIAGGDRYDNIPAFASLEFIINTVFENDLMNAFEIFKNEAIEKNLRYEPDMVFRCEEIENKELLPITSESFSHLASFVELCPSGTFAVNSIDNQVISSSNLATIRSLKTSINMIVVLRSLTEEGIRQMLEKSNLAANIANSKFEEKLFIPSFKNKDNSLTRVFSNAYKELYDCDIEVIKSQYSLDSSIVFKNLNVKMISLGVKYKQDEKYFYSQLDDISKIINLIENVLYRIRQSRSDYDRNI